MECKETSQLAGKAYEDSDYTMVIAIVHWLKLIVTVQKLFCLPVDCHCLSRQLQLWRHKTIFCVKASDTACIWSLQEFYKLLMTYSQLLLFQKPASYWNSTVLSKSVYVSYPGCILWASVSCELLCINWNKPLHYTGSLWAVDADVNLYLGKFLSKILALF